MTANALRAEYAPPSAQWSSKVRAFDDKGITAFYVSPNGNNDHSGHQPTEPLEDIEYAVFLINQANGAGPLAKPVTVFLMAGTHTLSSAITISNTNAYPLHFKAWQNAKPVVTGGRVIDGWKEDTSPYSGKKCLSADIPEVKNGTWYFRQLFVNGRRAPRPKFPKESFYQVEKLIPAKAGPDLVSSSYKDRFVFRDGDIQEWKNLNDINVMMMHYWQEDYLMIKSVSMNDRTVCFVNESYMPLVHSHPAHGISDWITDEKGYPSSWYYGAFYYVDNIAEAMTEPGEWYLDKPAGKLYYMPLPGETPENITAIAPVLKQHFIVQSDWRNGKYIEDMRFEGITFRHTEYTWSSHYGTGNQYGNSDPGLIACTGTKNLTIADCVFELIGDHAVDIGYGNSDATITGNVFTDLGGGAIKAIGSWREKTEQENEYGRLLRLYVTDNDISGYGRIFHGAVALSVSMGERSVLAHNHIQDGYMTAINCGGGSMGDEDVFTMFDTLIYKNRIHDIGKGMPCANDLGGVYTHGNAIGCFIRNNVISNIDCTVYGGNGIYVDDCASYMTVEDNLVMNAKTESMNLKGRKTVIRFNIFAGSEGSAVRRASRKKYETELAAVYKNIFIMDKSDSLFQGNITDDMLKTGITAYSNIIWSAEPSGLKVVLESAYGRNGKSFDYAAWCKDTGNGQGDVITQEPLFDFKTGNFDITSNSPAFKFGFKEITFSDAGVRAAGKRSRIPFLGNSVNGPEHMEALEYAAKIKPTGKVPVKRDMSTHVE